MKTNVPVNMKVPIKPPNNLTKYSPKPSPGDGKVAKAIEGRIRISQVTKKISIRRSRFSRLAQNPILLDCSIFTYLQLFFLQKN